MNRRSIIQEFISFIFIGIPVLLCVPGVVYYHYSHFLSLKNNGIITYGKVDSQTSQHIYYSFTIQKQTYNGGVAHYKKNPVNINERHFVIYDSTNYENNKMIFNIKIDTADFGCFESINIDDLNLVFWEKPSLLKYFE